MNPAHMHLIVNHLPVVGALFTLLLLSIAFVRKGVELRKVTLLLAVLVSLSLIPAFLTGEPAEDRVESLLGVDNQAIEQHEESALVSSGFLGLAGAIALAGLLIYRRRETIPFSFMSGFAVVMVFAAISLGWTANLGGKIRHSEIRGNVPAQNQVDEHRE